MFSLEPHAVNIAGLALLLVLIIIGYVYRILRDPVSRIPGPWFTRWTDMVATYHMATGRHSSYIHSLHEKYAVPFSLKSAGPVVRVSPSEVSFSDMSAVKEIYTVKETYAKSEFYTRLTAPTNKNVFAVTNIDLHRRYRRLLSAAMSETSLKSMYPTIEANVNLAIQRIGEELQTRGAADVFKWWLFLATDIIGELSFGESFRMLEKKQKNQYIEDLESAGFVAAMRALFPTAMWVAKFLPLPWLRYASESTERTRLSAEESIRRHERLEQADPTNVKPTLFSKMYKAEEDEQLTFNEVVDNAVGYIIAGSDTSATTLTYLVWCVCKHPEVKAALLRELATLPADGGYGDQELKQLPYLNAVIEETLRIHGAAPASLPRVVPRGGASLAGYWLNEGTTVSSQAYTLHRNPMTFPEPEKFDPSRWLAPTKAMKDAFFAFGGGSRICVGMHLSLMNIRLAVSKFFRRFPNVEISTLEGMSDEDMEPHMTFLYGPKGRRCLVEAH